MPCHLKKSNQQTFPCPVQGCHTQVRSSWDFTQHIEANILECIFNTQEKKTNWLYSLRQISIRQAPLHLHHLQMLFPFVSLTLISLVEDSLVKTSWDDYVIVADTVVCIGSFLFCIIADSI